MRWPRFVTGIRISRLFKGLILLALLKLAVLGLVAGQDNLAAPAVIMPAEAQAQEQAAPTDQAPAANAPADQAPADQAPAEPASAAGLDRKELLAKQDELNRREASLKQLESELDAKLVQLQELEARLKHILEQAESLRDKKMEHLINVYSNMKAKQAATVLETLDETIAVKILAGMQGRQAGEILTNVSPKKAAKLSEALTKMQTQF